MNQNQIEQIADALAKYGYITIENLLPVALLQLLLERVQSLDLRTAHIGREKNRVTEIRSDKIEWLEGNIECEKELFLFFDELQSAMNRTLF